MNSSNLFYVRKLQTKFYFKKNKIITSLFFLENYLFSLTKESDDNLIFKIKLKWIYDQIKIDNYSNELTKNFHAFDDLILKKKVLNLIEIFIQIQEEKKLINILNIFKKFNLVFNSIIKYSGSKFITSVYFQFFQFLYRNDFKNLSELKKYELTFQERNSDNFENVFIKIFFDTQVIKKKKLSKTIYLFNLLLNFFKNDE